MIKKYFQKLRFIHLVFILYIIICIVIAFAPISFYLRYISQDDSFYYFEIAKNIAAGYGPTFDTINKTNGFQPLWLIILVPIYLLNFDLITSVRIIIILSALISAFSLYFVYKILNRLFDKKTSQFGLLFWVFNALNIEIYLGGTEGAINTLLVIYIIYTIIKNDNDLYSGKKFYFLGFLLSLLFLARTDNIIIILCLILWLISQGNIKIKIRNLKNLTFFIICLIFLPSLYLLWNLINFNHILPIGAIMFGGNIFIIIFYIILCGLFTFIGGIITKKYKIFKKYKINSMENIIFIILPILHFSYYIISGGRISVWYLVLECLSMTYIGSLIFSYFLNHILLNLFKKNKHIISIIFLYSTIIVLLIAEFTAKAFVVKTIRGEDFLNFDQEDETYLAAIWLNNNTPLDAIIVSPNAGYLGYFTERIFIEIWGLVNSFEFFDYYKGNTTKFLIEGEYDYFVDRMQNIKGYIKGYEMVDIGLVLVHEIIDTTNPGRNMQIWYKSS